MPISVILPAYNCEVYLAKAISSILEQSFKEFELIIINDGSVDGTEQVVNSFKDVRIKYLKNDGNKGLIYSLNRGITEATGKYIARMDADDICLPERLRKQYLWLEAHPGTAVLATFYEFIDENDKQIGTYNIDRITDTAEAIKKWMPKENCVAHPSIMLRRDIIIKYLYASYQKNIEDYDLWLRLLSDGHAIEKLREVLLLYRVHSMSVTKQFLQKTNPFFKQYQCKRRFLLHKLKAFKFGRFELVVLFFMLLDLIKGCAKQVKRVVMR